MRKSLAAYLICVLVVGVGFCGYCVLSVAADHLTASQKALYESSAFADGFAEVHEAPAAMSRRLEQIPGIGQAGGRIVKEVRLADRCHCIRSGRSLFLIRRRYKNGKLFFPGTFHCSSVGTRICALSRHNEPTKNWTDEGATAYFLRIPFRRYSPFYRNGNHQPASTHQQMAYCRQLDSISFNPYRSF